MIYNNERNPYQNRLFFSVYYCKKLVGILNQEDMERFKTMVMKSYEGSVLFTLHGSKNSNCFNVGFVVFSKYLDEVFRAEIV